MKKVNVFGQRFCTFCGGTQMYYFVEDGEPRGECRCGNIDWCDGHTVESVKKKYGARMMEPDIAYLLFAD